MTFDFFDEETDSSWYFTQEQLKWTASRSHNFTETQIEKLRLQGVSYIQDVGRYMKMSQLAIATAIVFFQRFYLYQSFQDFPIDDIGACCLFLAGKVEDSPKKLKDIIIKSFIFQTNTPLNETNDLFIHKKEILLRNERILLQTLSFDLSVEHPYRYLLTYVKILKGDRYLAQTAWNFANDSLRTTLCLQYTPQVVSCASIALAASRNNYVLPSRTEDQKEWFHQFIGIEYTKTQLNQIGQQILDIYSEDSKSNKRPLEALESQPTNESKLMK